MATEHPIPTGTRFKNLTGQKFGRWTVLAYAGRRQPGQSLWLCRCDCGTERAVNGASLRAGTSRGCGCLRGAELRAQTTVHGCSRRGQAPEYRTWNSMLTRCRNPKNSAYCYYGGRGITVCERWRDSFEAFLADMGPRPSLKHSLDRLDNDKGYSPENCRWATHTEQMRNSRCAHQITFGGRTLCLTEWAAELGVSRKTLNQRLRHWPLERALTTPTCGCGAPPRLLTYQGRTRSLSAWSRETGLGRNVIRRRLGRGWTVAEALGTPAIVGQKVVARKPNKRDHLLTYRGRTQCLSAWAHELGLHPAALYYRLRRWSLERALTLPRQGRLPSV